MRDTGEDVGEQQPQPPHQQGYVESEGDTILSSWHKVRTGRSPPPPSPPREERPRASHEVFCDVFEVPARIRALLHKRVAQMSLCEGERSPRKKSVGTSRGSEGGGESEVGQGDGEEEEVVSPLQGHFFYQKEKVVMMSEKEIEDIIKAQLRKERKPFESVQLWDGREMFDLCFSLGIDAVISSLKTDPTLQGKVILSLSLSLSLSLIMLDKYSIVCLVGEVNGLASWVRLREGGW